LILTLTYQLCFECSSKCVENNFETKINFITTKTYSQSLLCRRNRLQPLSTQMQTWLFTVSLKVGSIIKPAVL